MHPAHPRRSSQRRRLDDRPARRLVAAVALLGVGAGSLVAAPAPVLGDEVVLTNGDKLTGTVGQVAGGKMKFTSPVLGEISIELKNVETYSTDAPAEIRVKGEPAVRQRITSGDAETVTTEDGQSRPVARVKAINPPPQKWTGAVVVGGSLVRGNTETENLGVSADAVLRRDDERHDDRFTLGAAYNFGRTGTGDDATTTTDNASALLQYDKFLSPKLYGYANFRADHDRIADLDYRLSPGVGLGYQWVERPDFNFRTEAGVSYVYEKYDADDDADGGDDDDTDDKIALRLAYRLEKRFNDRVSLFHNVEWLPAFDDPADYNLTADAGVRANLTKAMFSEFKVELKRDSTPAAGAEENDLRYILGIGFSF